MKLSLFSTSFLALAAVLSLVACSGEDGKLDNGETIACSEGGTNVLDATLGGTQVEVELYEKVDGKDTKVGSATWTPPAAK
jgi:hypothetical protein